MGRAQREMAALPLLVARTAASVGKATCMCALRSQARAHLRLSLVGVSVMCSTGSHCLRLCLTLPLICSRVLFLDRRWNCAMVVLRPLLLQRSTGIWIPKTGGRKGWPLVLVVCNVHW